MKFCSHSTHKGAPASSKTSKSYDWNVRNIAKISPKMAKISPKTAIFRLFSIFPKTVRSIRTKIFTVIFYTIVWSMCAISINSYNWDWSESEEKDLSRLLYRKCGSGFHLHGQLLLPSILFELQCFYLFEVRRIFCAQ